MPLRSWLEILLMILLYFAGQTFFVITTQRTEPNNFSLMQYVMAIYNFVADVVVFNQVFTVQQLFGTLVILGCLIISITQKTQK